ncbi:MAG TPA: DUF4236 domain-containing protein [Candidatus Krumholzibacteriaceae bacterium]|nr:DUF4236 domain-containing protein [Candidatus Krumholzibacteriaceae bacterium]
MSIRGQFAENSKQTKGGIDIGFRFIKRKRIAPGLTLNLSKRGGSVSAGPRGARVSAGTSGTRKTVGVPGTGLYYTERKKRGSSKKSKRSSGSPPSSSGGYSTRPVPVEKKVTLGFFKRLFTPQEEEDFVDGLKAFVEKDENRALELFHRSTHIADAAFMAGFIALRQKRFREAVRAFLAADKLHNNLGRYFEKYGISLFLAMSIIDEITAHIAPNRKGLLLGLVEAYQELEEYDKAVETLLKLRDLASGDVLVKVSLAELSLEAAPGDQKTCREIVNMASDVENESDIHAALLFYKGKALKNIGLLTAARDALTKASRRKKDRSKTLLKAIRYQRALVYGELGRKSRARAEFEKLYAEDPSYEDVAARLKI